MNIIDKLIDRIITKIEIRISKKENKVSKKDGISERLKLYRDLLDRIDKYRSEQEEETLIIRHYRYFTFKVDEPFIKVCNKEE